MKVDKLVHLYTRRHAGRSKAISNTINSRCTFPAEIEREVFHGMDKAHLSGQKFPVIKFDLLSKKI